MRNLNSLKDERVLSDSYREILPKYNSNNHLLKIDGLNKLKEDMDFTQIRFYCFKKTKGRVFHIMTNKNSAGTNVVKYFTTSKARPVACGSFTRLPNDNSSLAAKCHKWGHPKSNKWGHSSFVNKFRLFEKPITWPNVKLYQIHGREFYFCDDKEDSVSLHDTWQIFVR